MAGRLTIAMWVIVAWVSIGRFASAQTVSALVIEATGENLAHLLPYSEIPADATVVLPKGGKLVFLHYPTCRTVAVVGGTITFAGDTYVITGGTTEAETQSQCPRIVRLSAEHETGGTLLRGRPDSALTLLPQPRFVVVGKRAGDFASVRVSQGGREVLTTSLGGQWFRWPAKAPPLKEGREYELTLIPRRAGADSVTRQFKVRGPSTQSPATALTILKVE
jgi:hypothetical protein